MEKFLAMAWTKDGEVTALVRRVVGCDDGTGKNSLYEIEGGERRRIHSFVDFETLHDTERDAHLWIAHRLEKIAAAIQAKADASWAAAAAANNAAQAVTV